MGRLTGKVAVVTGGVSGIALGVVEMYDWPEGAKVIVGDVQAAKGAQLEKRFPASVYFSACDIRNEEDIAKTMAMAEDKFGGLDIVFHAAASVDHKEKIADLTTEAWDDGQTNLLRSHVMCIKHAIGPMQRRGGGSVILVSSAAAENFSPAASVVYVVCRGAGASTWHVGRRSSSRAATSGSMRSFRAPMPPRCGGNWSAPAKRWPTSCRRISMK